MSPVLLLDEPTTGLDSVAAVELVEGLARFARSGTFGTAADDETATPRTVVLTLHQPPAAAFAALDRVLLLARGGRVAYAGPTAGAADALLRGAAPRAGQLPIEAALEVSSGGGWRAVARRCVLAAIPA